MNTVNSEVFIKVAKGLSFAQVARAMNQTNIGSYIADEFNRFVREHGRLEGRVVPMAIHSVGGREWTREASDDPSFFPEPDLGGGWWLFEERHVSRLYCKSATSGSELEAVKQKNGTWKIILSVPGQSGAPYKGAYWDSFNRAIGAE
jgi:hypothetical protein